MKKIRIMSVLVAILLTSSMFLSSSFASPRTIRRIDRRLARALIHPVLNARDIINSNSPNIILSDKAETLGIDLADVPNYLQLDLTSNTFINCYNDNWDLKIGISLYSKSSPPVQKTITVPNASLRKLSIRTNDHNDTVIIDVIWGVKTIKVNLCGGRDYLDGSNNMVSLWIIADNVVDELPDYITTGMGDDVVEIITEYQNGLRDGFFTGYIYTQFGDDLIIAHKLGDGATIRGGPGLDVIINAEDGFDTYTDPGE